MSKTIAVTCKCGHKGQSKNPAYYLCTACRYEGRAQVLRDKAIVLMKEAGRVWDEAQYWNDRAAKFRAKHKTRTP